MNLAISFGVAQFIAPFSKKLDFAYFLVANLHLLAFIILGFLLIAVLVTILPKLTHANGSSRLNSLKTILLHTLFVDHNQLPRLHLRMLFLFFNLYIFLNLNFLSSSIKTEKVTVPTEEIVDSISKLIKTPKTLSVDALTLNLKIRTAPEGSFFKQLSKKHIITANGLNNLKQMKARGLHHYVLFNNHLSIVYIIYLQSQYAKESGLVAFHKLSDYVEELSVYKMRKKLDEERKRFINSR